MKLIYFGEEAWEEAYVKEKLPGIEVVFHLGTMAEWPEADPDADALSVFVNSQIGAAELDRYPKLACIATRSTGFDHIAVDEARRRNIAVLTVPSYGEHTVAEFSFALLLALSRRVCDAHRQVAETGSFSQAGLAGFDLQGKTIGIVGGGHIGLHVVKIAAGFGMRVLVFDVHHDDALAQTLGFQYAPLEDVLARSDVVTLHVPYNKHTHHLLNRENMPRMKRGAYLINTSRGAVVETEALVAALKDGVLGGAGLDVLEEEGDMHDEIALLSGAHPREAELKTVLENHYLIKHPRVIITPHIAFDTVEAIRRILDTTIENIAAYQRGTPQNAVRY